MLHWQNKLSQEICPPDVNSLSATGHPGGTSDTVWLHVEEQELAGQSKTMLSVCTETPIRVFL